MTFIQLVNWASVILDDVNNGYFTVPQVKVWCNNAQKEVQKLLLNSAEDYYTVCALTSTIVNQKSYEFPDDFLKILRLEKITQGSGDTAVTEQLQYITRNEQNNLSQGVSGDPNSYVINKRSFSLFPTPNITRTLRLFYAYRVTDMVNDSDEPDVPEDYQEFIAILAARDGFLRDGRSMDPINGKLAYFEKLLKENSEQRNEDTPRMVRSTDGWGLY